MPKRIQRSRAKGWRMPEGAVCVCRPGKHGNPFRISQEVTLCGDRPGEGGRKVFVHDAAEAVALYRQFTATNPDVRAAAIKELRGKDLVCWCGLDQPCHADVLLEIANEPETNGGQQ